jgi:hypothetical protein
VEVATLLHRLPHIGFGEFFDENTIIGAKKGREDYEKEDGKCVASDKRRHFGIAH